MTRKRPKLTPRQQEQRDERVNETREALKKHDGNRTRAADELGISRQALVARIRSLKLSREWPARAAGRPPVEGDNRQEG